MPTIATAFDIYQEWTGDNGDYTFYLEHPNYPNYLNYMIDLVNNVLINLYSITNDKADAVKNFSEGKSIAIACSVYEVDNIMSSLSSDPTSGISLNGLSRDEKLDLTDRVLTVVGGFEDSNGEIHTFHTGGYSYVTVIPKYMYQTAAYTVDHINKKIIKDNFISYYIGEENVHYTTKTGTDGNIEYIPIEDNFDEINASAGFCTGTNPKASPPLWRCRVYNKLYS